MRVLYLSRGANPHDHRFLSALAQTEHEIYFLPLESTAARERAQVANRIKILEAPYASDGSANKRMPQVEHQIKQIVEDVRPDLIHAGPIQSGAYLVAKADWHPLVSMSWGSDLLVEAEAGEGKNIAEYTLRHSDVLVCDSEPVRQAAIELGMPGNRIVVFPWGVDLERFSPGQEGSLREQLGWQDDFIVLSTREWEPDRGVDLIVKAFIQASGRVPSLRLLLLRDGSMRATLLGELEAAGLSDRVHIPGTVNIDGLSDVYHSADLYVSASHSDGSSISLLEAMASGLPALVSDIPGNREWVEPGDTGWWFEDGNSSQLADRIWLAAAQRRDLAEMGHRARAIAEVRGDWEANFAQLMVAYRMATSPVGIEP